MDNISKVSIISNYQSGAVAAGDGDVFAGLSQMAFANNNVITPEPFTGTLPVWPSDPLPLPDVGGTGTGSGSGDNTGTGTGGLFGSGSTQDGWPVVGRISPGTRGNGAGGGPAQVYAGMTLNWLDNTISLLRRSGQAMNQMAGGRLADVDGLDEYAQAVLDAADALQMSADGLAILLGDVPDELSGLSASEVWSSLWGLELRVILTEAASLFQAVNDITPPEGLENTGLVSHAAGFWSNPFMGLPGWITGDSTLTADFFATLNRGWLNRWTAGGQGRPSDGGTGLGGSGNGDTGTAGTGSGDAGGLFGLGNSAGSGTELQRWETNGEHADWLSPILQMPSASASVMERYDALSLADSVPAASIALDDWLTAFLPSDGLAPFAFATNPYGGSLPDAFATSVRLDTQT